MNNIFLISDTHFGHKKLVEIGARHFSSIEEQDETIIENWNKTVSKNDTVYHLGDVALVQDDSKTLEILKRLKGILKLIPGNHDSFKRQQLYSEVMKIQPVCVFIRNKYALTHIPINTFEIGHRFQKNIHGHLHKNVIDDVRYINVSCEQINYTPINLEEIES